LIISGENMLVQDNTKIILIIYTLACMNE